jgi:tight adherence protein B
LTVNGVVIAIIAFLGVASLVGGVALLLREKPTSKIEDRLAHLTGKGGSKGKESAKDSGILSEPLDDDRLGFFESFVERIGNLNLMFEQADTNLTVGKFIGISAGMAVGGTLLAAVLRMNPVLVPLIAIGTGMLPLCFVSFRRGRRLKTFGAQLPDALEMLARALRSGQSLQFGFNMVASEMPPPIGKEFGRVFEEQNLGIPMDETLRAMTDRVPNLDLKFFVTALILQRQTGGDLAEILDKIGELVRERFRIWGQVQALTGEGRLSGIVLMALPFLLFAAVYQLNPSYVMVLFTDPMGTKMLTVAVILQILGALTIRKIVNIKV